MGVKKGDGTEVTTLVDKSGLLIERREGDLCTCVYITNVK